MKRGLLIVWLVLLVLLLNSLSDATKIITVKETDFVNLKPKVRDEDSDKISFFFTKPLNKSGQWQTSYGDAGEYNITLTVSDGKTTTTESIKLIVKKKNVPPEIVSFSPQDLELIIDESNQIEFLVEAVDINKDKIIYEWELNNIKVEQGESYTYKADYGDAGIHTIKAIVSDGEAKTTKEWKIRVNKVDRETLLRDIQDIEVNETDVVRLKLPDFEKYNLSYTISEPIGNDNYWKTTYNDAGTYEVTITISDRNFKASKKIMIKVNDVDRPPKLKPIANIKIRENQKITINLEAYDPDNDEITYIAENLPEGATLEGNKFEWQTNYDTVKKENIIDEITDKFHLLSKRFKITFIAKAKGLESKQTVSIKVKNVNRAPIIRDIQPIKVKEGETIKIKPNVTDPDGDKVIVSYLGWMKTDTYKTTYEDAGKHIVIVKASDGFLETRKRVEITVEETNRPPEIQDIKPIEIKEKEKLEIPIVTHDPENDLVNLTATNPPDGSRIEDNKFIWTPDYNVVKEDHKTFEIELIASDGKAESRKKLNITVYNVNRAPRIISKQPPTDFITYKGHLTKLSIEAEDPDNDSLTYTWKFGMFEKYENTTPAIIRRFTIPGMKKITVIVSDGKESTKEEWKAKVIEKPIK